MEKDFLTNDNANKNNFLQDSFYLNTKKPVHFLKKIKNIGKIFFRPIIVSTFLSTSITLLFKLVSY